MPDVLPFPTTPPREIAALAGAFKRIAPADLRAEHFVDAACREMHRILSALQSSGAAVSVEQVVDQGRTFGLELPADLIAALPRAMAAPDQKAVEAGAEVIDAWQRRFLKDSAEALRTYAEEMTTDAVGATTRKAGQDQVVAFLCWLDEARATARRAAAPLPPALSCDSAPNARSVSMLPGELRMLAASLSMVAESSVMFGRPQEAEVYRDRARQLLEMAA